MKVVITMLVIHATKLLAIITKNLLNLEISAKFVIMLWLTTHKTIPTGVVTIVNKVSESITSEPDVNNMTTIYASTVLNLANNNNKLLSTLWDK